jgi:hydrogenase maturation protease
MYDIAVIGIGNLLQQDEGVGVHAIRLLKDQYFIEPKIDLIDGGTTGLDLIPLVEGCEKVLFIDALELNAPGGTIAEFKNDEIQFQLNTKMSLHHLGLQDLLATLVLLEKSPPHLHLIGVQPYTIEAGIELSDKMQPVLKTLVQRIIEILQNWGIRINPVSG